MCTVRFGGTAGLGKATGAIAARRSASANPTGTCPQASVQPKPADERAERAFLTVSLPLRLRRPGGCKLVQAPEDAAGWLPRLARVDSTLVKALARAHRWQRMLESGSYASVAELAAAERINASYLARILRLTLLAPDSVESILDGRHNPDRVTLNTLFRPLPVAWEEQRTALG